LPVTPGNVGTAFNRRSTAGPLERSWEICDTPPQKKFRDSKKISILQHI
jgi:hypothetical protein